VPTATTQAARKARAPRGRVSREGVLAQPLLDSRQSPFGASGARCYDHDCNRLPMRYKRARALQNNLVKRVLRSEGFDGSIIVDFGVGTANDGVELLTAAPRAFYLGIDRSAAMLSRAMAKIETRGLSSRCAFLRRDFHTLGCQEVNEALLHFRRASSLGVVLSALALHHSTLSQKTSLYGLIYNLLATPGRFVLTDLFSSVLTECAAQALDVELEDLRSLGQPASPYYSANTSTLTEFHYTDSNNPQPLALELAALRTAGFRAVDVVFRDGQLAVLAAEK